MRETKIIIMGWACVGFVLLCKKKKASSRCVLAGKDLIGWRRRVIALLRGRKKALTSFFLQVCHVHYTQACCGTRTMCTMAQQREALKCRGGYWPVQTCRYYALCPTYSSGLFKKVHLRQKCICQDLSLIGSIQNVSPYNSITKMYYAKIRLHKANGKLRN